MVPVLCEPLYRPYVWGGRNLERMLGRRLPASGPAAESWEVSDLDGWITPIASGPYAGFNLRELIARDKAALLGRSGQPRDDGPRQFPLLVKYLDAQALLSVQVHPDDAYAAAHEGGALGKTEMWLVLEAAPTAELYAGLRSGVGREEFAAAAREERLPELVRRHAVKPGDVVLMPAGRVHALGAGIIVLEVQQTSDVTYRLHDWGRLDPDGKPRPIHIDKALDVIDFHDTDDPLLTPAIRRETWGTRRLLAVTPYFAVESWDMTGPAATATTGASPHVLMVVSGVATIRWEDGELAIPRGRTAVIPAALGAYVVEPTEPTFAVRAHVPDFAGVPSAATGLADWPPDDPSEREHVRAVCDRRAAKLLFG